MSAYKYYIWLFLGHFCFSLHNSKIMFFFGGGIWLFLKEIMLQTINVFRLPFAFIILMLNKTHRHECMYGWREKYGLEEESEKQ